MFKIHSMTIVVRSVVERDNKFYPQISLNHCPYEIKAKLRTCSNGYRVIENKKQI